MRLLVSIVLVAGLGAGGYFLWKEWKENSSAAQGGYQLKTAPVETRDISFSVTVAGEIAPAEQVSVRPEVNGRIATLSVDIGDRVKKGEVLFTLDDQELQNQRSASLTEIDRAKLQLDQAERNYNRNKELHDDELISDELFEASRTELALAKNALERAQRDLAVAEERLTKTQIVAPFDCTVLTRPVSVGQAVSGSGGVGGGTEVLTIADLNQMVIHAHVNQADVTRMKSGQEVSVQVEAVEGLKVTGVVDRIAPQATIKNSVKGFAARVVIKNLDPRIQPGMTANLTIPVASVENVPAVPLAAVFTDPERGERYVYVKNGMTFERRPIRIGVADYFNAEVLSGLRGGETVALGQPPEDAIASGAGGRSGLTMERGGGGTNQAGRQREGRGGRSGGSGGQRTRAGNGT